MEAYLTGAIDFSEYVKHRHSTLWNIKYHLILSRISAKVLGDTLKVADTVSSDMREKIFDKLLGRMDNSSMGTSPEIAHVTAASVMAMTDDQRLDLYNKIVASVK